MQRVCPPCLLLLILALPLWPQVPPDGGQYEEPLSFVGMKLDDLFNRFGSPQTVHAARGEEHWQDDVVFMYADNNFYIYRDRVWQVGVKTIYGIRVGDNKAVALLVLGEAAQDSGDYILYPLPSGGWPLSLRINCSAGKVSSIFVYRTDY